jgi:hypothetical protein
MGYEISQFDILNRQLMAGNPQPKANIVSDIGEAKVTRTIFGRAKVRVIRGQDRKRRTWLLTLLVVIAFAAAAWQGWVIFQRVENKPPQAPLSERISVSPPVFRPAHIAPDPHPSRQKSISLIQSEINSMLSGPLPRHPPGWVPPAKPGTAPLAANKPQTTPAAATSSASANQTKGQQALKPSAAIQPAAATVVKTPQHTATTPQPAAKIPAAAVPLAGPLAKRDATTLLHAGNGKPQVSGSVHD